MNLFRSLLLVTALACSAQASAGVHSYSFNGTLSSDPVGNMVRVYEPGLAVSGTFELDDAVPGVYDYPGHDYYNYYGAFSGSVNVNNNTINFGNSVAYVYNWPNSDVTTVTMLGGNAWNTGGWISETDAPAGYAIDGFQIRFDFHGPIASNTPIHSILANHAVAWSSLYLSYGIGDNVLFGNWGDVIGFEENPAEVPEPNAILLTLLALFSLFAMRRSRS